MHRKENMSNYKEAIELINCLKEKNFFQYSKKNALENIEKVTPETLQNFIFVMEKSFNIDRVEFEYRPIEGILVRINFIGVHPDSVRYETKKNYSNQFINCPCKNPCYRSKYAVKDFIDLINRGVFEPIEFYPKEI